MLLWPTVEEDTLTSLYRFFLTSFAKYVAVHNRLTYYSGDTKQEKKVLFFYFYVFYILAFDMYVF